MAKKKPELRSVRWFGRQDIYGMIYRGWMKNRGVPHDQFDFNSLDMTWVSGSASGDGPDAWHPDDALLVPLTASDGRRLAFLSLDEPVDGRRPGDAALEALSAVASIVASVIEHDHLKTPLRPNNFLSEDLEHRSYRRNVFVA